MGRRERAGKKAGIGRIVRIVRIVRKENRKMRPGILSLARATLCILPVCGRPWIWGGVQENTLAVTKDGEVAGVTTDTSFNG